MKSSILTTASSTCTSSSFALLAALLTAAGCSGTSSGASPGDTDSDGAAAEQGDDGNDAAVSSGARDGASDAHATGDAKGTTVTTGVDAGDAPAGQAGANVYCEAICDREATCLSVAPDASTCHCTAGTLTLYRSDYVAKLAACESEASCQDLLSTDGAADSGLDTCAESALAQISPTTALTAFCSQLGLSTCPNDAVPDCPDTFKVYSDESVSALSTCIADPNCNDHAACVTTALTP